MLRLLLLWVGFTGILTWLPLIRSLMDGDSYAWGVPYWGIEFSGDGLTGDVWAPPLAAAHVLATLFLGYRGARQPFHWLLLAWVVPLGAYMSYFTVAEDMRLQGDTMGMDFSLAWVGPVLFGGMAVLAAVWVVRDLRARRAVEWVEWPRSGRVLAMVALAALPVQLFLLRYGPPHDTTDQIGVILTIVQWIVLNVAFARRPHPAAPA
jgi:hypothetical protein